MNTIRLLDNTPKYKTFGSVGTGTIFHYPTSDKLYMKTDYFHGYRAALSLSDGLMYDVPENKDICPVRPNSDIVVIANVYK